MLRQPFLSSSVKSLFWPCLSFCKFCCIFDIYFSGSGLVFTEGETWSEHRRFSMSCLRDFGMGKIVLETTVHTEVRYLLEELTAEEGRPFDPSECLPKAVSNIICSIIYGSRFEYTDESMIHTLK